MRILFCLGVVTFLLTGCGDDAMSAPSSTVRLLETGWSFGLCLGPCNGTLDVDGRALSYLVESRTGELFADNRGELTSTGVSRLRSILAALPKELLDTYGCPDCADAGAAYVVVSRDGSSQRSHYEYPSPPRELAALDAFLKDVMDALGSCEATADAAPSGTCTPARR